MALEAQRCHGRSSTLHRGLEEVGIPKIEDFNRAIVRRLLVQVNLGAVSGEHVDASCAPAKRKNRRAARLRWRYQREMPRHCIVFQRLGRPQMRWCRRIVLAADRRLPPLLRFRSPGEVLRSAGVDVSRFRGVCENLQDLLQISTSTRSKCAALNQRAGNLRGKRRFAGISWAA